MAILSLNQPFCSIPLDSGYYIGNPYPSDVQNSMSHLGRNILYWADGQSDHEVFNNGLLQVTISTYDYQGGTRGNWLTIRNLQTWDEWSIRLTNFEWEFYLAIGYDEDPSSHYIYIYGIGRAYYDYYTWSYTWSGYEQNNINLYNAVVGSVYNPYNWVSIPSVSGKNGILSLAQIKAESINDGEPVSGASVLAFDSLGNVNIPAIIDEQMPIDPSDPTSVTVGYLIPPLTSGQYSALKILVKQDNIPKDENDADKVVDIEEPTNLLRVGSAVVSGLTPLSHYYFVVKVTDDADVSATSEPKDITLDVAPLDTFFAPDFGTDGKDITRYNASKTIHVHMDIGYVAYDVDYYAAQGALADPSSPSNPAYTISNGEITTADDYQYLCWAYDVSANQRIIPPNCTLWFEFDAFFVNEEGYLDWRMYDDSGLEIIYWCWDTKYAFDANIWYNCKLEATVVNGIITQIKYYVDNDMVSQSVTNIHMLCIDEDNPRPLYFITFQTTELTKLKNMKIYWE